MSRGEKSHPHQAEQAYRAFKRQVIALAESAAPAAPIEKDAVMQTGCRMAKRVGA